MQSIWRTKNPAPPAEPSQNNSSPTSAEEKEEQKSPAKQQQIAQQITSEEEDQEKKRILVKVSQKASTRALIKFCSGRINDDWQVCLSAYGNVIAKMLRVVEILKVRCPFLHQLNEFQNSSFQKVDLPEGNRDRLQIGIKVTLCKLPFENLNVDDIGYQKPKPRTFLSYKSQRQPREELPSQEHESKNITEREEQKVQNSRKKPEDTKIEAQKAKESTPGENKMNQRSNQQQVRQGKRGKSSESERSRSQSYEYRRPPPRGGFQKFRAPSDPYWPPYSRYPPYGYPSRGRPQFDMRKPIPKEGFPILPPGYPSNNPRFLYPYRPRGGQVHEPDFDERDYIIPRRQENEPKKNERAGFFKGEIPSGSDQFKGQTLEREQVGLAEQIKRNRGLTKPRGGRF